MFPFCSKSNVPLCDACALARLNAIHNYNLSHIYFHCNSNFLRMCSLDSHSELMHFAHDSNRTVDMTLCYIEEMRRHIYSRKHKILLNYFIVSVIKNLYIICSKWEKFFLYIIYLFQLRQTLFIFSPWINKVKSTEVLFGRHDFFMTITFSTK